MVKKCRFCGKEFSDKDIRKFISHTGNCRSNPEYSKRFLKLKETLKQKFPKHEYKFNCKKCENKYTLVLTEKEFKRNKYKKYCSRSCANTRVHSKETKLKIGKSRKNRKICEGYKHSEKSRKNMSEAQKKYYDRKIKEALKKTKFEYLPKSYIKKLIFKEIGNNCEECGYSYTDQKSGKGPFEIHHIDGNNKNNKRDNLKLLCLNCHWKTSNWRFRGGKHSEKTRKIISECSKQQKRKATWFR